MLSHAVPQRWVGEEEGPLRVVRHVEVREVGEINIVGKHSQEIARKVNAHNEMPLPHWSDGGVIQFPISQRHALWLV